MRLQTIYDTKIDTNFHIHSIRLILYLLFIAQNLWCIVDSITWLSMSNRNTSNKWKMEIVEKDKRCAFPILFHNLITIHIPKSTFSLDSIWDWVQSCGCMDGCILRNVKKHWAAQRKYLPYMYLNLYIYLYIYNTCREDNPTETNSEYISRSPASACINQLMVRQQTRRTRVHVHGNWQKWKIVLNIGSVAAWDTSIQQIWQQ